jgi:2-methylisocitrate lyase-like PEP mutase family enzyme
VTRRRRLPRERQAWFRRLLQENRPLRFIEAHDGLSAMIAEDACAVVEGRRVDFDGLWLGSFADSASKGLPDASIVGIGARIANAREVLRVSRKPILFDGDTGGEASQLCELVKELESIGVSGVVVEDKVEPKRNSLAKYAVHVLEERQRFAWKLHQAKQALLIDDFAIVARIESLIAGESVEDALLRARAYVAAGAAGILIHSREEVPSDLFEFASAFNQIAAAADVRPFLACVPTTYNQVSDSELYGRGFRVIIHGNQLLRAAYSAMQETARLILQHDRSLEADAAYATVEDISDYVGLADVVATDAMLDAAETRRP